MTTLTLTSADVERVVEWEGLLIALERAHTALATGVAMQPAPHSLRNPADLEHDAAAVVPMMSLDSGLGLFAVKVLADAPRNRSIGLPAQRSTVCVFSSLTGECVGVVDGKALTRIRTAAVTALATRVLARPDSRVVALLGSGPLAIEHALAISRVLDVEEIRLWSRSLDRSAAGANELRRMGVPAVAVTAVEPAVKGADVVCTLTPSRDPILPAALVRAGMHINAVGSPPRPAFSEIGPAVFARATRVVVDSLPVALNESGNVQRALADGALLAQSLVELGGILVGAAPGREGRDDVTIYNSVGIGLQDLAAADHVLRRAAVVDAGTMVKIRD